MASLHDEIRAALPDFALGTIDPRQRARLQAHVAECMSCQAELAQLRTVMTGIGAAHLEPTGDARRPRGVPHAIVIRAETPPHAPAAAPPARSRWLRLALGASLLMMGLAGFYGWLLRHHLTDARQQATAAADYVGRLRQELVATRREAADLDRVLLILAAPGLLRADVRSQPAGEAHGRAFWAPDVGLLFRARGLPALDSNRIYQLWTIRGTTASSVGLMRPDAAGGVALVAAPTAQPPDAFGVTVEPAGGSAAPTLPMIMLGRTN